LAEVALLFVEAEEEGGGGVLCFRRLDGTGAKPEDRGGTIAQFELSGEGEHVVAVGHMGLSSVLSAEGGGFGVAAGVVLAHGIDLAAEATELEGQGDGGDGGDEHKKNRGEGDLLIAGGPGDAAVLLLEFALLLGDDGDLIGAEAFNAFGDEGFDFEFGERRLGAAVLQEDGGGGRAPLALVEEGTIFGDDNVDAGVDDTFDHLEGAGHFAGEADEQFRLFFAGSRDETGLAEDLFEAFDALAGKAVFLEDAPGEHEVLVSAFNGDGPSGDLFAMGDELAGGVEAVHFKENDDLLGFVFVEAGLELVFEAAGEGEEESKSE